MSGEQRGQGPLTALVLAVLSLVVSFGLRTWMAEIAAGPDAVDAPDPAPADNEGLVIAPPSRPDEPPVAGRTPSGEAAASRLLYAAARLLERSGSFAYTGTAEASGPSVIWPTGTTVGQVTVAGRVELPGRSVERSTGPGTVVDTLVSGRGVWQRAAPTDAEVATRPWAIVAQGRPVLGLAGLPDLVADAVPTGGAESMEAGARTVSGVVPAVGVGDPAGPHRARLDLRVDAEGTPDRVTLTVPAQREEAVGPGPVLRLDVAIEDIGVPVDLGPPGEREVGITPPHAAADLRGAGLAAPVQLTRLPPDWVLAAERLDTRNPGCPTLTMVYGTVSDPSDRLSLTVSNVTCAFEHGPLIDDPVPLGGPWVGRSFRRGPRGSRVEATDGTSYVYVESSTVAEDVLVGLAASLGPYDQLVQPSMTVGPDVPTLG